MIGRQQQFLVSCEARAWSLNRLLPPDGPAPRRLAGTASPPSVAGAGATPRDSVAAAAAVTARQVTEGMARRGKERAAGRVVTAGAGFGSGGKAGLGGRLLRSSSHGGQGGGLEDMAHQN